MGKTTPLIIIGVIVSTTVGLLYFVNKALSESDFVADTPAEYSWIVHGLMNVLGYSTIFLPGYFTYKYIRSSNYLSKAGGGLFATFLRCCFGEDDLVQLSNPTTNSAVARTPWEEFSLLAFYFVGLQGSYLVWGVLQEKVMTQEYHSNSGEIGYFKESQFLVFVNRILAFWMAGVFLLCRRQPRHRCPLYKYAFCSFSNTMSSWCQYEALKYVSFPHQVLAKAAKTIPVMLMGKIVSKTKYEFYEYATAALLSLGMLFFMVDAGNDRASSTATTFSGALLLSSYIAFDSFTSNWQGALFKTYAMTPVQMMCYVNLTSCVFTLVSLVQQGTFLPSIEFMINYPQFVVDCVLLSVCSASGQLFIFSTIANFGPLVFAIITTIRQGFSVLLSCLIYHHEVNAMGIVGVVIVFVSVLLRIYCGNRLRNLRMSQGAIAKKPQRI